MNRGERQPLSRDRVAGAALALIDAQGVEALSMRKLGAELGVEAMSLYNHVSGKGDILDLVSERLYAEILAEMGGPDPDRHWHDEAHAIAFAFRAVALRHPSAFLMAIDRPVTAIAGMTVLYRTYQAFRNAGMSERNAGLAFHIAGSWLHGAVTQELGLMAELARGGGFQADDVPDELAGAIEFKNACLAWSDLDRFNAGLAVLLEGFRTLIDDPA